MIRLTRLTTFASAILLAACARGDVMTSSDTNMFEPTEISQTVTLDKFDTNLGTLNSAVLSLSAGSISTLILDNDNPNASTFNYSFYVGLVFSSPLGLGIPGDISTPTLSQLHWQLAPTLPGDDGDGAGSFNGGLDEQNFGTALPTSVLTLDVTAFAGDLAMAGGGVFSLDVISSVNQSFLGGGGNIQALQTTNAASAGRIDYNFTPIPEPSSMGFLTLVVVGLLLPRRKLDV